MRSTWTALAAIVILGGCGGISPSAVGQNGSIATNGVPSAAPNRTTVASASPGASAAPTMRVDEPWIAYQWDGARTGLHLVRPDGTDAHESHRGHLRSLSSRLVAGWHPDRLRRSKPMSTRSGSSTRTGPTLRRSCREVPTARSAAVTSRYRPGRPTVRRSRSSGSNSARAVSRQPSSKSRTSPAAIGGSCTRHHRRRL